MPRARSIPAPPASSGPSWRPRCSRPRSQESRLLIVDLQGVTYFGSAGLNAVLDCHKQGLRAGTSVRLVADNGLVVRPIEVTNLDSLLELYPTLPDALEGRDSEQGS